MFALALMAAAGVAGTVERSFPVSAFHAVDLAAKATVEVTAAPTRSVLASGDPAVLRCLDVTVQNGVLTIDWHGKARPVASSSSSSTGQDIIIEARLGCRKPGGAHPLTVHVAAPTVDGVRISGHGSISVAPLRSAQFSAAIPGGGSIMLNGIDVAKADLSIDGDGHIVATGRLGQLHADLAGSGSIDTTGAVATASQVYLGGHGSIAERVDGMASGTLAGSGSILVKGSPACAVRKAGSGRITCPA